MSYDPTLALDLGRIANQAYTDDMTGVIASISGHVARVIVRQYSGGALVVSFRGTEPTHICDWLADFDADMVPHRVSGQACKVHDGFADTLAEVSAKLDRLLLSAKPKALYVTGHSLGGAMALLYAASRSDVTNLYTFGQPRVGNAEFAKLAGSVLDGKYVRVVNDRDIVPRVPDELLGYHHAGRLVAFDHAGKLTMPAAQGGVSFDLVENVTDHLMTSYLPLLEKMQPR